LDTTDKQLTAQHLYESAGYREVRREPRRRFEMIFFEKGIGSRGADNDTPLPRVMLMCGVAGAGKTAYALRLEAQGYVRLSIDEEVWSRFGRSGVDYEPELYQAHSAAAEKALQSRLVALISAGESVVLDFSFWDRARRDRYKHLIEESGGVWELVYLKVDREELRRRLAARADRFDANAAFPIDEQQLDKYLSAFQVPCGEGERIVENAIDNPA
jgi:predicted kinase